MYAHDELIPPRDCIGIAKTGSGKTLAYILPLLRHAKDQPPCQPVRRFVSGFIFFIHTTC